MSSAKQAVAFGLKKKFIIAGFIGVLIVAAIVTFGSGSRLQSSARRAWKDQALKEIAVRVADPAWPGGELAMLKTNHAAESNEGKAWFTDRVILMRNSDWLAFANICHKEDYRIHDLFLARGSDGGWYYSTYHFCKQMIVLRMDDQAENLAAFVKNYSLRPFDGQSDECLKKTWPPETR